MRPNSDPNLGYLYDIPTADQCRANPQAASQYGWRKNHYAYCQVKMYTWTYENSLTGQVYAAGQDRITVIGQGSWGDAARNGGDGRVMTLTLYVDQQQVTVGALPAGSTLTIGFSCTGDPAGSCQSASPPVTMPDPNWNNNSATYTFTSPDGVGYNGDGGHWVAFADGSFHWTITPDCTSCTNNGTTNGPNGLIRFDGPGSPDMSPAHQTGATFQPVDAGDTPVVDSLDYAYNGIYGTRSYAIAAHHYYVALNFPNSTYPLTGNKTIPTRFTRLADQALIDNGRDTVAIPLCRSTFGADYATRYGRGTDGNPLQCDEFPFAATYQGSPLRNGLPDGTSMSVCPLNGPDNGSAGLAEKAFFAQQRIFDGGGTGDTAIDWFAINVTNVPTPAPTPAQALPCPTPDPAAPGINIVVANIPGGGAFVTEWDATGDDTGVLGDPTANYQTVAGGQQQLFTHGGIYWSSPTGTHEVSGAAYTDYASLGATSSALGFPSTEPLAIAGGQESLFAGSTCGSASGGAILSSASTPASAMQGCIYQAYLTAYGGPAGTLGFPTSNETAIGAGRVNYMSGTTCNGTSGSAIYFNGAAHAVTGCIFQDYKSAGEATGTLGFPTGEAFAISGGMEQVFQHGYITSVGGVTTSQPWLVGHAAHAGNDYPYETIGQFEHQNEGTDDWSEYYGQCDSFAAWKVYENLAGTPSQPPIVPDPGWIPSASPGISPVNQNTWGNADNWGNMAPKFGYTVDQVPSPGAIVWWRNASADPQNPNLTPDPVHGMGGFGHVGYVTDVYPDGSITIEQYNLRLNGEYSTMHMPYGQSAVDTSFNQGSFTVPWPAGFVHIGDGPSGQASPAEPANGTVSWGYPGRGSQLQVVGPTSSSAQFSTGNVWYNRPAHGEIGAEMYTHANGPTAVSTATWTPSGLSANACYRVDAFVPDNYSDDPIAVYTVTDVTGTNYAAANENDLTNDWSDLGVYKTNSSGSGLSVRVDDRGGAGLYVAADAMRFWRQADCSAQGDASPIMMPNSYYPSGSWSARSGHGFFGTEQYTTTTGTLNPSRTATWSPPHLLAHACYDVSLYVPDNYSDNPAATYNTNDVYYGGNFWPTVDENIFTNQFAGIGTLESGSGGYLPVSLQNNGPSGDYVAADAAAFVLNTNCLAQNNGTSTFGQPMSSGIIGPGSPTANFTTTGNWSSYLGFGWANHQLYSPDNAGATATWTFNGNPGGCYTVDAYIPIMGYADNTKAGYVVSNNAGGGLATVNQNTAGGWTNLSRLNAGSDGKITVKLTDNGNSGGYTAADAIRFTGC